MNKSTEFLKEELKKQEIMSEGFLGMVESELTSYRELMTYYRCAMMEVETKFKVLNQELSLTYDHNPIETIKTRLKTESSIANKIYTRNLPLSVNSIESNIFDIAGIRIICSFIEDIYELADCFLKQDDIKLIEIKDYIKEPKPSGYRSLHLIIEVPIFLKNEKRNMKVEVQMRTIAMDFWASLEHKIRYKKELDPKDLEFLSQELEDCANISANLDIRMQAVKNYLMKNT